MAKTKVGRHPNQRSGKGTAKDRKKNPNVRVVGKGKGRHKEFRVTLKDAPPGFYDLGIDQAQQTARLGAKQQRRDISTQTRRNVSDLGIAQSEIGLAKKQFGEDLATSRATVERQYGQTLEDLLAQQQGVERGYSQLANQQSQGRWAAGVEAGGAAAQAAQKRAANQAIDVQPINVARTRSAQSRQLSLDDLLRQQNRAMDPNTGTFARQLGQAGYQYQNQAEDLTNTLKGVNESMDLYNRQVGKARMQSFLEQGGRRRVWVRPKQRKQYRKLGVI